ncbi:MAG TPA: ABC transporter permease subunit [Fusibacter sp.]|nr:ABC transporter permease subunit [Fusibacter sp.]
MNILMQELKMGRKSLIVWCTSLVGTLAVFMMLFPVIADQAAEFEKVFASFPEAFRKALGLTTTNLGDVLGYYSFAFLYVILAGAVQAMNLGVAILSAEVRDKTGDFLFVKPVKRTRIITMKILAVLVQILIVNVIMCVVNWFILSFVSDKAFDMKLYILLTGSLLFVQLFFASFGLAVSVFLKRIRTVLPISMGVVFLFYIIYLLNQTLEDEKLAWLSPFGYFDLAYISQNVQYQGKFMLAWVVLIAMFIFFTYKVFTKKDLPSI